MNAPLDRDRALRAGARGIAAGLPLDWRSLESSADGDAARNVIRQLRVLSDIADVQRRLARGASADSSSSLWDTANANATPAAHPRDGTYDGFATWGPLTLLERVGEGAFGEVYRAWDSRLDREVALKLLHARDSQGDIVGRVVIDEGRMLARVSHPNVVTVHGADRIDGRVGLWMEFVRGRTLEHLLHQNGAMSPQEAAAIGLDLCRALSAVHRAGLVHRDVKAQNVMREANGRVVLMDFGTGELVTDTAGVASIVGTPLYLAPELLRNESLTPAADLYSLGVLLYHLVTGGYPVAGASIEEIRLAHQLGRRQYLRDVRPDLPVRFVEVIERSLCSDTSGRFESAGMMERALAEALVGDVSDRVPSPRAAEKRARPWPFASRWAWGALLAVLTVTVVLLVLAARNGKTQGQGAAATTPAASGPIVRNVNIPRPFTYIGRPAPSGRHLTYVDNDGDLAVVDPTSGAPRKLTSKGNIDESGEMASAVSADGTRVAYAWRTLDSRHQMRVIDIDGKSLRLVVSRDDVSVPNPIQWSRDGKRILSLLERTDRTNALAMVDSATSGVTVIKDLGRVRPHHASMSPDGRYVAFDYPQDRHSDARDIFLIAADGKHEAPLIRHESSDMFPMWTADGRLLFFSDRTAGLGAWLQTVVDGKPAGEPRLVDKALGRIRPIGLTDSGTLFFLKPTGLVDVYVADLDLSRGPSRPRVIAPNYVGENLSSGFSRDGRFIAWMSMRGLVSTEPYSRVLSIRDLQTGEQRDLLPALAFFTDIQWAPDGRRIMVRGVDLEQRTGRHIVDVVSGRVTPAIIGAGNIVGNAVWSADGTEILYGRRNTAIVARTVETGAERVLVDVSAQGFLGRGSAQTFGLSPDGRAIAFRVVCRPIGEPGDGPAVGILRVQPLAGAAKDLISVEPSEGIEFQDWSPDGRSVLFTRFAQKERRNRTLWRIDVDGGEPRSMGLQMDGLREVRVRSDGRLMTFTAGDSRWEVWAMEDFLSR